MRILVTGATGFLGTALVPALLASDHVVICPPRAGKGAADLSRPESYRGHMDGVEAVIHLAAFNPRGWSIGSLQKDRLLAINSDATGALGRLAAQSGVQHFLFASSARVYGVGQSPYSEGSPLLALDPYGQAKMKAEAALESAAFGTNMALTIMRFPMVEGKSGGVFSLAARLSKSGIPLPEKLLDAEKSVIDREMMTSAIKKILNLRQGGVVNIANPQTITLDMYCTKLLGEKSPRVTLPNWLISTFVRLPWLGYPIRHALSDCILETTKFDKFTAMAEKS